MSKTSKQQPPRAAEREFAEQVAQRARDEGVDLVGPGRLLQRLTKQVLETGLEVEMSEHLGYGRHDPAGRDGGNSRNGRRPQTVTTEVGPVQIEVPRDRDGSFEPKTVRKRQRRLSDFSACVELPPSKSTGAASEALVPAKLNVHD